VGTATDAIRYDRSALIDELKAVGAQIKGPMVKCPFHDDNTPSGSIYQGKDKVWRFKCHAASCSFCGDIYDIRAKATGQSVADVLKISRPLTRELHRPAEPRVYGDVEQIESQLPGRIESRFFYTNPETGRHDLVVLRIVEGGKKSFRQLHAVGNGYVIGSPPKPWPLYNRTRLMKAGFVIVVEGEKCVHALQPIGVVATTSPAGAGKAEFADWTPLAGKLVYLWPDNDIAGINHMKQIAGLIERLEPAPEVYFIEPSDLELAEKADAVDWLSKFNGSSKMLKQGALVKVFDKAKPVGASRDVQSLIEDTISGRRVAVEWPWRVVSRLTKALLPGTVTLLCGDPGSTKSFFLLEALAYWYEQGIKIAVFELEEDRGYHLYRTLAQRQEKGDLFNPDWVKDNPEFSRKAFFEHREFLNGFGRCIYQAPDKQIDLEFLAGWVEDRAKDGCRIIAVDPVTAAASVERPWVADSQFMMAAKAAIRQYDTSLILVTHPRKGRKTAIGLDELAGGAAYQRFSQTVMWLERFKNPKTVIIAGEPRFTSQINRCLRLIKTRNGQGHGLRLGFIFHGESLRFAEQGVIVEDD